MPNSESRVPYFPETLIKEPRKMKAIVYHEFGETDVLKYEDMSEPELGPGEVLIETKAASINFIDLRMRSGKSPRPVPLPHVGGVDVAGVVRDRSGDVSDVEVGRRVIVMPAVRSEKGLEIVGVNLHGGFAEYVKVPARNVVEIPEGLSFDDASTLPTCYVTAWYAFCERTEIREGETVLVHAAGSGTGSAAIQVAKLFGCFVIATAGSDEKLEKAREIGADVTVNYNSSKLGDELGKIAKTRKINVIFDPVGASVWKENVAALAPGGKLLLIGVAGGGAAEAALGPLIMKDLSVLGVTVFNARAEHFEKVARLTEEGKLRPSIHSRFHLSEAATAQKILEDRRQFGKVVLNP